jgi:hypothetical protein
MKKPDSDSAFVGRWPTPEGVTRAGAVRRACSCAYGTCERCLRQRREQQEQSAGASAAKESP